MFILSFIFLTIFLYILLNFQINGTSKKFWTENLKRKRIGETEHTNSDSEESLNNYYNEKGAIKYNHNYSYSYKKKLQNFSPSTPPRTTSSGSGSAGVNYKSAKRRKGIPHRAPLGALIIQY